MWIGISKEYKSETIKKVLQSYFNSDNVKLLNDITELDMEYECFEIDHNSSEFPLVITYIKSNDVDVYNECMKLAKYISIELNCNTICDGSDEGDDSSPCWSVVWKSGISFLADDCGTKFADNEGGEVKIVRMINIDI